VDVVESLHREWPDLSYDVTIKIEHLLQRRDLNPVLRDTGCLFVTSAVESLDDAVLERLQKGHTRADFHEALGLMREAGLPMSPTFIPFTPWTTRESYRDFLRQLVELGLSEEVAPIQLAIRLLLPQGSVLLEWAEGRAVVGSFDESALTYPWRNPLDPLCSAIQDLIRREERRKASRWVFFRQIWSLAEGGEFPDIPLAARATIPYLTEPWYC